MTIEDVGEIGRHEFTRRSLHRWVDSIATSWPRAVNDANQRGWPPGRGYDAVGGGGGPAFVLDREDGSGMTERVAATGVEIAAVNPGKGAGWLAELFDVLTELDIDRAGIRPIREVRDVMHRKVDTVANDWPGTEPLVRKIGRLANMGAAWWPPPAKLGDKVGGVTVGQRTNSTETCTYCQSPVTGGHADPLRRIGDDPYHAVCAQLVKVQRGIHPGLKHDHGTPNRYNGGCLCAECRAASTAYHAARRAARRAGL